MKKYERIKTRLQKQIGTRWYFYTLFVLMVVFMILVLSVGFPPITWGLYFAMISCGFLGATLTIWVLRNDFKGNW